MFLLNNFIEQFVRRKNFANVAKIIEMATQYFHYVNKNFKKDKSPRILISFRFHKKSGIFKMPLFDYLSYLSLKMVNEP